jgi:hypothetical protein
MANCGQKCILIKKFVIAEMKMSKILNTFTAFPTVAARTQASANKPPNTPLFRPSQISSDVCTAGIIEHLQWTETSHIQRLSV